MVRLLDDHGQGHPRGEIRSLIDGDDVPSWSWPIAGHLSQSETTLINQGMPAVNVLDMIQFIDWTVRTNHNPLCFFYCESG